MRDFLFDSYAGNLRQCYSSSFDIYICLTLALIVKLASPSELLPWIGKLFKRDMSTTILIGASFNARSGNLLLSMEGRAEEAYSDSVRHTYIRIYLDYLSSTVPQVYCE